MSNVRLVSTPGLAQNLVDVFAQIDEAKIALARDQDLNDAKRARDVVRMQLKRWVFCGCCRVKANTATHIPICPQCGKPMVAMK